MLVLSRKQSQKIIIGGNIVITVVETRPHGVRLGIEAPAEIRIDREEIAAKRKGEPPCGTLSNT